MEDIHESRIDRTKFDHLLVYRRKPADVALYVPRRPRARPLSEDDKSGIRLLLAEDNMINRKVAKPVNPKELAEAIKPNLKAGQHEPRPSQTACKKA